MGSTHPDPFEHDDPRLAAEQAAIGDFTVECEPLPDGRVQARPVGDLDLLTAPAFRQRVDELLAGAPGVVIDLGGLTFIDSAGLRAVLLAHEAGAVELRNPSSPVRQTFAVAKMSWVLQGGVGDPSAGGNGGGNGHVRRAGA
jgi:anti-anti-sigma factor